MSCCKEDDETNEGDARRGGGRKLIQVGWADNAMVDSQQRSDDGTDWGKVKARTGITVPLRMLPSRDHVGLAESEA
jgi:hypothetical protein